MEDDTRICYRCRKAGHLSRDCQEHPDESIYGHSSVQLEDNPRSGFSHTMEMGKIVMEEDDIHGIGEEDNIL
ncbi:hypothetical protein NMG60_11033008 [Bertholletia excelsa]